MRLVTHFERCGFNPNLLEVVMEGLEETRFSEEMLNVLLARQRFQSIIEPKSFFYLSLLCDLLSNPEFRGIFMRMQGWKQVNR